MAVPYIFATVPGGSSIPLSELDANFAYITSGNPVLQNLTTTGNVSVGGTLTVTGLTTLQGGLTLSGPLTIGSNTVSPNGITGTNLLVFNTSPILNTPTFVAPTLGTPTSGNLANCTNLPVGSVTGVNSTLYPFLLNPNSANLAAAVTDETGAGQLVFNVSPVFVGPALGTPVSGNLANCTGYPGSQISGVVPISSGGTGQTTAAAAANALLPAQTPSVSGYYLTTNGAGNLSWTFNSQGTVLSVDVSGGTTGLVFTGGPVTSSGVITMSGTLGVSNGGTGLTSLGTGVQTAMGIAVNTPGGFVTGPASSIPSGAVMFFASTAVPAGWLEADGSAVSRTTYAALFAVIGTIYGSGDGSTTFNIPNLYGQFIRGWDQSGTVDPGRVFGSNQTDTYKNHTHVDSGHAHNVGFGPGSTPQSAIPGANWAINGPNPATQTGFANIQQSTTGGTETRPVNVALLACIKT